MKSESGIASTNTIRDYILAVARDVHADSVDWWEMESIDVVLVLPFRLHNLPDRNAVLSWNRNFGWSLGVEGLGCSVVVIDGLGIGRMPSPAQCSDRTAELIDDYCRNTPAPPGVPDAAIMPPAAVGRWHGVSGEAPAQGRRERVIRRPYLAHSRRSQTRGSGE
ncbi:hypothetical protein BFN03_08020 [Rhodococcus sp. WMMA185]|uniref:DUF6292 family protein n=1 Tax=Rhodococcus sp. WMMA185 TaxID=679318 RepID=UPI000878AF37|nr:DUF6292 family protein [Rhodococcus sp. WMMA185]AOW92659.1 hypothetical protein BFN03_08020 [Rhodococcus sp. WMMA185]